MCRLGLRLRMGRKTPRVCLCLTTARCEAQLKCEASAWAQVPPPSLLQPKQGVPGAWCPGFRGAGNDDSLVLSGGSDMSQSQRYLSGSRDGLVITKGPHKARGAGGEAPGNDICWDREDMCPMLHGVHHRRWGHVCGRTQCNVRLEPRNERAQALCPLCLRPGLCARQAQ